mmetsp:Transcript_23035/g.61460  ORF Transcript_23035/g.61460 Transcript_23035/m.61460 type:complete len:217 (-) Transcript_23035:303-953(-)
MPPTRASGGGGVPLRLRPRCRPQTACWRWAARAASSSCGCSRGCRPPSTRRPSARAGRAPPRSWTAPPVGPRGRPGRAEHPRWIALGSRMVSTCSGWWLVATRTCLIALVSPAPPPPSTRSCSSTTARPPRRRPPAPRAPAVRPPEAAAPRAAAERRRPARPPALAVRAPPARRQRACGPRPSERRSCFQREATMSRAFTRSGATPHADYMGDRAA